MANLRKITRDLLSGLVSPSTEKREAEEELPTICRVNNPNVVLSVIINYYRKQSTIFRVLEKLSAQSLHSCAPEQVEVIVVDDGTDGETMYKDLPPEVIYLWQRKLGDVGYGICRAKNTGAKIANGKYLVFLDADILVGETYLESILRGFQKYGDRVVQCAYIWDYFFTGCPDPRTEFGVWENPDHLTSRFFQLAGGSMAISKNLFVESGGFDEDLIYGEVEDILFGYQLGQLPQTAVYFNRQMECWHIPHPPSAAHAEPGRSWNIVKTKYPDFYDKYIVRGLR